MPWYIMLIIEIVKLIIPAIFKAKNDPKPNKEAAVEIVNGMRGTVGLPPSIKKV